MALPQTDDVSDFHCVTTWSRFDNHWRGVRIRDLAELAVPTPEREVRPLHRLRHSCPAPTFPTPTNVPLARAIDDDVLLVHTWEGQPLPREHGGPVRVITPKLYAWKGTKWIRRDRVSCRATSKGFWEVRGYSNYGGALVQRSLFDRLASRDRGVASLVHAVGTRSHAPRRLFRHRRRHGRGLSVRVRVECVAKHQ